MIRLLEFGVELNKLGSDGVGLGLRFQDHNGLLLRCAVQCIGGYRVGFVMWMGIDVLIVFKLL